MTRPYDVLRIAAMIATVWWPPSLVVAQHDPQPLDVPAVFSEVIDVRVVNIEVVVTDAAGKRVTGLGRGDFRVLVDGTERPIDFWSEVRDGEALAMPPAGIASDRRRAEGSTRTWSSERAAPDLDPELEGIDVAAHSTSYLVFVDD